MKHKEFEFGRNDKLKRRVAEWSEHENYEGYCIVAPHGCGKTSFLKMLEATLFSTEFLTGDDVIEKVYQDIRNSRRITLPVNEFAEVLLVDHLDEIDGRVATMREVCWLFKRNAINRNGDKRLIICTFVSERAATNFASKMGYELLFMKSVKPNGQIVSDVAKEYGLALSKKQINEFVKCDSMLELRNAFKDALWCTEIQTGYPECVEYKLILTSRGLNTLYGRQLMHTVFERESFKPTNIFIITLSEYEVDDIVINACKKLGFQEDKIYLAADYETKMLSEMPDVDYIYVTEGNTFEVVNYLRRNQFDLYIKKMIGKGANYMGASAGAIISSFDFKQAENFDSNYMLMEDFTGLCLLPEKDIVIPHYDYEQLQRYIAASPKEEIVGYSHIYNIRNEEALVFECSGVSGKVEIMRKKRIRLEP